MRETGADAAKAPHAGWDYAPGGVPTTFIQDATEQLILFFNRFQSVHAGSIHPIVAKNSGKIVNKEVKKTCGSPWNMV
jgi:hypothetical protein